MENDEIAESSFGNISMPEVPVDPGVTRELFLEWRSPRFGKANPEQMTKSGLGLVDEIQNHRFSCNTPVQRTFADGRWSRLVF